MTTQAANKSDLFAQPLEKDHLHAMQFLMNIYRRMRFEWNLHYFWPIVPLAALLTVFYRDPFNQIKEPGEPVEARITSLAVGQSKYQGRTPGLRIVAQTEEGIRESTLVMPPDIDGCEVGDPVRAEQVGMILYLYPAPCDD